MKTFAQLSFFGAKRTRIRSHEGTVGEAGSITPGVGGPKPNRRRGRLRVIFFHLAAIVVVLSPLVLGELVLRLCIPRPPLGLDDPYVSFSSQRPLFVLDSTSTRFDTAENRLTYFCPQSFAAAKGSETFRVFCLGGSTVQGRPYSIETSFTTWLKLNLRAARPGADYEVVNCGGVSYATYRLVPIMRELLAYEPDLFIIYTGHNEFLEDRTYRRLKRTPRALIRLHQVMLKLRSYGLAHQFLSQRRAQRTDPGGSSKTVLPTEVQAKLDFRDGLESYHRDQTWRQGTIEHFGRNLETMVQMSRDAGVPLILVNPVSNLKDCPPFKSESRTDLSERQTQRVLELRERAGKLDWADAYGKLKLLEQAAALDSRHAELLYLIGKCYEHIGRSTEAKNWFVLAKEEDVCPLRILEPMHDAILDVAARYDVPLVDVKVLIKERTEDGVPGDEWLLDHVHLSVAGHQLIADSLYQTMEDMELVRTPQDWWATREELWQRHLSSLNEAYFARGLARLKWLHEWSRGPMPDGLACPSDSTKD
ncbi:MAG: SGNH/GDSL hydrolase family protein [Phycisphaerales bacterium]|nr:MAG: SGNH/GDSL hydrolase family protein [Phycisphaerales bacterium]